MRKNELAQELRKRQYQQKLVARHLVDALTDDQIIDAYITCSGCGEKEVSEEQLPGLIARAKDADSFFALCEQTHRRMH
jgi:hypothetical protein